ncbi:MAG: site-specific integrase [Candidatus Binataceae bacterium]
MPRERGTLIDQLRALLTDQRYSSVVIQNYCRGAEHFLEYLARRKTAVDTAKSDHVSSYLRFARRQFHQRHGHRPAPRWESIPRAGIHALLRLVQKPWPPEQPPVSPAEALCRSVCNEYREWLQVQRGLAKASIRALMWEGRNFLSWYAARSPLDDLRKLNVREIDWYFEMRAAGLRRRSLKDVAERLRSLVRFLHRTDRIGIDLAPRIIAPVLYAYESIPSALSAEQISAVLKNTRKDRSPLGYRDYAILLLLSTYGLRDGEITRLRLEDIDWHAETLHIRHSKTGASSQLPLMAEVGGALLNYLRRGRPKTDVREIFIRTRAPYRRLSSLYSEVRRRLEAAGVKPLGKCGPHTFRHARAVSLLRASVSRKVIGDLLGHRSEESTLAYLKLATEDLRAIALKIPEARA